jgi:hypothetical protein
VTIAAVADALGGNFRNPPRDKVRRIAAMEVAPPGIGRLIRTVVQLDARGRAPVRRRDAGEYPIRADILRYEAGCPDQGAFADRDAG